MRALNSVVMESITEKIEGLTVKHDALTAGEYISLWSSVWDGAPAEQTGLALSNTLFRVSVYDGQLPVAMARMIGDMGLCY